MTNHSLYTMEEELRRGYITVAGGHRIGIAGRTVLETAQLEESGMSQPLICGSLARSLAHQQYSEAARCEQKIYTPGADYWTSAAGENDLCS